MKAKLFNTSVVAFALGAALSVFSAQGADVSSTECEQAITSFKNADPGMQNLIDASAGYAVFPNVGKGGFIVGGARGSGCVFENGKVIGQTTMTQASIGAQAGGQSFAEIILFQNQAALDNFKGGNFEMSAGVSGVVASQGASRTAKYSAGVAVFTLPKKGLMAEASVGGQKFTFQPMTTK